MPFTIAYTSLSESLKEFTTFFTTAFELITSNWLLGAAVAIPLVAGLVALIISLVKR